MRKFCSLVLIALSLCLLCSCNASENKEIAVARAGYSCLAEITYNELEFSAKLNVAGGGIFSLELTKPKALSSLKFDFNNNEMTVSYMGLKNDIPLSLDNVGFAKIMNNVFLTLTADSPRALKQGDVYNFSCQIDGAEVTLSFNEQGLPLSLSVPSAGLSATFSDWNYAQ